MLSQKITSLLIKDAKNMEAIHAHCFEQPWEKATFESLLFHGAFGWGHRQGFILLRMHDILTFCVHPHYRGEGIGRDLLEVTVAKTPPPIYLEVDVHNGAAIRLYQSYGFACLAHRADYYGKGKHALSMGYLA